MGNKNYHNKKDNKPNRQENLSTTIGDLLKAKGESIPEAKKKDFKHKKGTTQSRDSKKVSGFCNIS